MVERHHDRGALDIDKRTCDIDAGRPRESPAVGADIRFDRRVFGPYENVGLNGGDIANGARTGSQQHSTQGDDRDADSRHITTLLLTRTPAESGTTATVRGSSHPIHFGEYALGGPVAISIASSGEDVSWAMPA